MTVPEPERRGLEGVYEAFQTVRPMRRLTPAEADRLGFAGPLVLYEVGPRFRVPLLHRLQAAPVYRVHQRGVGFVMGLSAAELAVHGITP